MEGGIEAGNLDDVRVFAQQDVHGLQRKRLMQRGQRDVAAQVGQRLRIDAGGRRVLGAAVHHAVRYRNHTPPVQARPDALADDLERRGMWMPCVQFDAVRGNAGFAEVRRRSADALHLAIPQRRARKRVYIGCEQRELDA